MKVAVIGASDNPGRYSYMAIMLLKEKGHAVFPVHPKLKEVEGIKVYPSVKDIPERMDTLSLYVSEDLSNKIKEDLLSASPRRIIFNPGAENPALEAAAREKGIETLEACTMVMLRTNQFSPCFEAFRYSRFILEMNPTLMSLGQTASHSY